MGMSIEGVILKSLLLNPENSLEHWSRLKLSYFSSGYTSVYTSIVKFYDKYGKLPSFNDLDISVRSGQIRANISALYELEIPDNIDVYVAVESLIDQFTQNEALTKLEQFVENITLYSTEEIKEELNNISLYLEEKTHSSENIYLMSDIVLMDSTEMNSRVPLGISNEFHAHTGGAALTELIMIGGYRGSGKSIVSSNIACMQYLSGNVGVYFSIEMRAREVFNRSLSILSGVSNSNIRKGLLSNEELNQLAIVRANMFEEGEEFFNEYRKHRDFGKFERELVSKGSLKKDNQLIIVDNQQLTISDIDLNLQKFKAKFGDKLKVVVVDYVNQISTEDSYDWKSQVTLSKKLKDLARKYEVVVVAPFQVSSTGEVRFAKGLLDAADLSLNLKTREDAIIFETTKSRNVSKLNFGVKIDWDTLKMYPEQSVSVEAEETQDTKKEASTTEKSLDIPF